MWAMVRNIKIIALLYTALDFPVVGLTTMNTKEPVLELPGPHSRGNLVSVKTGHHCHIKLIFLT